MCSIQACVLLAMVIDIATAEDTRPSQLACPNKLSLKCVQDVEMPGAMRGLGAVGIDKAHPIGLHAGEILIRTNGKRIHNLEEYHDITADLDPQAIAQSPSIALTRR